MTNNWPEDEALAPIDAHRNSVADNIDFASGMNRNGWIDIFGAVGHGAATVGLVYLGQNYPDLLPWLCLSVPTALGSLFWGIHNIKSAAALDATARTGIEIRNLAGK